MQQQNQQSTSLLGMSKEELVIKSKENITFTTPVPPPEAKQKNGRYICFCGDPDCDMGPFTLWYEY